MNNFTLMTDSTCDLSAEMLDKLSVVCAQGSFTLADGTEHTNATIDNAEFYKYLREGGSAKTSAINSAVYEDMFRVELDKGNDIVHLGFSSGLSATYNCARMAAEELSEQYPDRKIYVVDTLCASLGHGLIVYLCAKKREEGATAEEVYNYAEAIKNNIVHRFTVNDLYFLKRGGRVSSTTAFVGSLLNIKPLMHVDYEGKLHVVAKARGRKAAIEAMVDYMAENAENVTPETPVFICHGDCIDDANMMADMVKERFGIENIYVEFLGPFIGAHAGPGTLALFFVGKER